jgi:hypothetical protein
LRKCIFRYRKFIKHQTIKTKEETCQTYHNQNTQHVKKILKAAEEKRLVTCKVKPLRITADFSTQTLNARRSWKNIFQALKENNYQLRLVYPAKTMLPN